VPDENLTQILIYDTKYVGLAKYKNILQGNYYEKNFAGFGEGLINSFGFSRLYMIEENFISNGENTVEITNYFRVNGNPFIKNEVNWQSKNLTQFSLKYYT
jgi:hypothetical protein